VRRLDSLHDQHLHSHHSFDSNASPQKNVERAIERGLGGLTFTEHFDTHPTEWPRCVYDDEKIEAEISALRDRYGQQVFVGKGIEVCWQPKRLDFILDFLSRHSFDLVIVSVHWAYDKPVHERERFEGWTVDRYFRLYLEAVRDATAQIARMKRRSRQPFHILGHMDFARRYAKQFFDFDGPIGYDDLIDQILTNCLDAEMIPEVNTSTLRNKMDAPMPGPVIMRRYAALGGTMMSIGSDAHSPQHVGADFDRAIDMLKSSGIQNAAIFRRGEVTPALLK